MPSEAAQWRAVVMALRAFQQGVDALANTAYRQNRQGTSQALYGLAGAVGGAIETIHDEEE